MHSTLSELLYNLKETNWNNISFIIFTFVKILLDIIKLLIKAFISGFNKIGSNKILKKNLEINIFFSIVFASGNLVSTNLYIILQIHLIA